MDQVNPFLGKLREMLEDLAACASMWWSADGRSVVIHKARFCNKVLGLHFKTTRYKSFSRQLNLHGFRQIARRDGILVYRCELFNRHEPERQHQIVRMTTRLRRKLATNAFHLPPGPFDIITMEDSWLAATVAPPAMNSSEEEDEEQEEECEVDGEEGDPANKEERIISDCFSREETTLFDCTQPVSLQELLDEWNDPLFLCTSQTSALFQGQ